MESFNPAADIFPPGGSRGREAGPAWARSVLARLAAAWRWYREGRDVRRLTDRELRDLQLTRVDVCAIADGKARRS